jgi:hypothetical protein
MRRFAMRFGGEDASPEDFIEGTRTMNTEFA